MRSELVGQLIRFGLTGVANTALGLGVIAVLDVGLHVNSQLANAVGYGAGMTLSYLLNRHFVFRPNAPAQRSVLKFLTAAGVAFILNQLVLLVASHVLGNAPAMRVAAQAIALASYTLCNFVLCRAWVFRTEAGAPGLSKHSSPA